MRITSSMYYQGIYSQNNNTLTNELFDVNKQIASGLNIQYASDDVRTFTETMRLDNEMTTLNQVKTSVDSGYKVSDQTDITLNDFEDVTDRMRTLLIQAGNDTNDEDSRDAIAQELRGLEKNLKSLANTSVNGKYLFSGTATGTKPISDDGTYNGNDGSLNALMGSNNQQQYNLSGAELFLGEDSSVNRQITSNVVNENLIDGGNITSSSTIRELMGDKDNDESTVNTSYFYIRGSRSDGTAVNEKISLQDDETVDKLLDDIGTIYGNTAGNDVVNVSLNSSGEIVIEDKRSGSSKLDFHMVGAVDFDLTTDENGDGNPDDANVANIDLLNVGETDYDAIKNGTATSNLYVKEFVKTDTTPAADVVNNIDGLLYDRTAFSKEGSKLESNVPQIVKSDNAFASPSTKISEVADLSQGTPDTINGTVMKLVGKDIDGNDYTAEINFDANGSTFSVDTTGDGNVDTSYNIYDMGTPRSAVDGDDMTYQQMMDVMNMVVTNNLPASSPGTADEYDAAIRDANEEGEVVLSYDGKFQFQDLTSNDTKASISMYDANSGNVGGDASVMTFNTNNALTVRDPKTDFFKTIDTIIKSVENYSSYPDASGDDPENVGIENAIAMMDDLKDHLSKKHAKVGAQSNTLDTASQRTSILQVSTESLRSSVIDTDMAEASLRLTQLNTNYEAMLSTVGKVSKLSLVNYL